MAREMKDSGIEWIGEIPKGWNITRLCYLISGYKAGPFGSALIMDKLLEEGEILVYTPENIAENNTYLPSNKYLPIERKNEMQQFIVHSGDIIFPIVGSLGRAMYITDTMPVGIINQRLAKFHISSPEIDIDYFLRLFAKSSFYSTYIDLTCRGSIIVNLTKAILHDMPVPLPPISNQKEIVDYLDKKCLEIDNVLEKTRASIEEYKKLKQAVITQAVTKGIRGDREMKDSRSTWFGQIPSDWDMRKIKYIFKIQKDIAGEEGHTVLSITQKGIKQKDLSKNEGQLAENYSNYQLVHIGDFAMNHMDLLTGWVDVSKYEGVTSPDYRVFRLIDKDNYYSKYYLYLMQMCYTNRIFYGLGQGVSGLGRWRLQADKFLNFSIIVPSYEEQEEIANYLEQKCSAIDDLIAKKEQYLSEIENYKKSLIYEYVTGKKEVPQEYRM